MTAKQRYLMTCAKKRLLGAGKLCPSCGFPLSDTITRKFLVASLKCCRQCKLQFRTPTTSSAENEAYYQSEYSGGPVTELPDAEALANLKNTAFRNSKRDFK